MNNELLKLFDIKDDVVETFTVDHKESNYEIDIRFKPSRFSCPTCGSTHFISKGNKKRSIVSVPVNDKPVKMVTYVKRYKCIDCNASFSDVNPIAYGDWSFTRTAIISILNRLKPYNATYASIARMFGVSSTRIMEIFDTFVRIKRHSLPRVLLIDEFHFSRNSKYKYPAILMNFENNLIIDIVESRTHDIMSDYLFKIDLEERKKVEYICTDMSFIFKPLLKTYFPNSTLLVDHFHVTRLINDQLNHTRKRIMRKYVKNKKSREYSLVVRLKGGDPYVFGRGGEEALYLRKRKIDIEVVPGVSSVVAALADAGIPITHRGIAKGFQVITAHSKKDEEVQIDYTLLTDESMTCVFLMGLAHVEHIAEELIRAGRRPENYQVQLERVLD